MDNQRLLLFVLLSLIVIFIWEAWEERNLPPVAIQTAPASGSSIAEPTANPQIPQDSSTPALPTSVEMSPAALEEDKPVVASTPDLPKTEGGGNKDGKIKLAEGQKIRVLTDVLDIDIDTVGGDVRRAFLVKYPVTPDKPEDAFPFMHDSLPRFFIAQSGLLSKSPAPDHRAVYQAQSTDYKLDGNETISVPLVWVSNGLKVTKTYTFTKGSYVITVSHRVENSGAGNWVGREYRQFQRTEYDEPGKSRLLYTFTGGAVSMPGEPYEKINFEDMKEWKPEQSYVKDTWVAMLQHYFVSAWVPGKSDQSNHIYTKTTSDQRYILGMTSDEQTVSSGQTATFDSTLYIGPKIQKTLEQVAPNLNLTIDFGWLYFVAQPLFWTLQQLHDLVGNWGWSIILLTLIIKLMFFPLSNASYRSMAHMRKLAPKFQAIRERYGDDRQRMSQATMEIYKKEKVNPLSGCWPMLVQIPVFIALYWVLLESVELRQASFMLWLTDLSAKDPYYVLPVLMGISMFVQQKLSANPSLDPLQQKIMQYLPLIFTLFFMLFPAGLVLYWVVNNVLSIAQQWYITRKIEQASK
ncbi:MAG: membrane protein insertase YidC [Gammaproteobacteria bacterium]|nr:membrane protein insertase YidC [Gammaproteobacteria bacterium]MDH5692072.1 membrane protein insertase YidC [Gammaproteobacteria bacterium]